ncbi:uncharacterized protein LOC142322670 [Lycorma delicatula]|uniref:uncharacterized protein LOC142322670 n=1 Tax=Lycorma delicatula TaxID=130591 RepID=UPI003F50FDD9
MGLDDISVEPPLGDKLRELKRKRGYIKGRLTRIINFVDSFDSNVNSHSDLKTRFKRLEECWSDFNSVQSEIWALSTDDQYEEEEELSNFEERYYAIEKIQLLSEINEVLQERQEVVQKHNQLLQEASDLQNQVQETKRRIQRLWNNRVEEAKLKGADLDSELKNLRQQLQLAQQQSGHTTSIKITEPLDASKSGKDMPSRKANYKITASRLQGEIKALQHRVNTTKLRLLTEIKNKNQVENEVRQLRVQLSRRSNAASAVGTPVPSFSPRGTEQHVA